VANESFKTEQSIEIKAQNLEERVQNERSKVAMCWMLASVANVGMRGTCEADEDADGTE
jgi:hypothetical protein